MICMRMVLSLEERKDIEQQNWQDISRENCRWIPTRNLQKLIICIFLFLQVQFDIGAHEENDYLIMTIYDERYPDHKRNLLLEVEKNPEWWEWKDNK